MLLRTARVQRAHDSEARSAYDCHDAGVVNTVRR